MGLEKRKDIQRKQRDNARAELRSLTDCQLWNFYCFVKGLGSCPSSGEPTEPALDVLQEEHQSPEESDCEK